MDVTGDFPAIPAYIPAVHAEVNWGGGMTQWGDKAGKI